MPAPDSIASATLARLIGTPGAPVLFDLRPSGAPFRIPGASRRTPPDDARAIVVIDANGGADAHAAAARLRYDGRAAEVLEGGHDGWANADLPLLYEAPLVRDADDRTHWVTRSRPKVDRIACPWLIRRFIDPHAVILYVPPGQVEGVAKATGAMPFDIVADGVRWSHRGEACTFDALLADLGLGAIPALARLAPIIRGADIARPDLALEVSGLLAVSLGLSRLFDDDQLQLEAGLMLYDALYRWARDAQDERHDWTSHPPRGGRA